jgi:hypothetical protein
MSLSTEGLRCPDSTTYGHWVTTEQLAKQLCCSRWHIQSLRNSNVLLPGRDYIKIGRFVRWDPNQVQKSLLTASEATVIHPEHYEMPRI